ncbi:MAG: DNA-binding LacI/PurR family transcriptional regulator [Paracoccaceae bacterium]|jgi:DNA-binding LacI/PurR family transcriptional regulator
MVPIPDFLTIAEQAAAYLRGELMRGRWSGTIPGTNHLAPKLGINAKTVEAALQLLEQEGLLVGQGAGRRRRIELPEGEIGTPAFRIAILDYEPLALTERWTVELQHLLMEAGCEAFFTEKCLLELRMDVKRVSRMVEQTKADAWVVASGSSEVLGWFAEQETPAFALFGCLEGLPMAGAKPDKPPAYAAATRQLIGLGHRRIAMLAHRERRLPMPGHSERAFLAELAAHGISAGPYNLPDWQGNTDDFHRVLDSLFGVSPPTALIIDGLALFIAAQQFLGKRRLRVPEDVSLVCTDGDPGFARCQPSVAHIHWDHRPVVRRVLRWTTNVASGKEDLRQTLNKAEFIEGGTVGPAPTLFATPTHPS